MRNQKPFSYREVASEKWIFSLVRQLRELQEERRNPPPPMKITAEPDLEALDRLVEGPTAFASLRRQIQEFRAEAANPTPRAKITAQADPHALEGLIETQSPFLSIYLQARTILAEIKNPQRFETTAGPVEVEPLWSEWKVKKAVAVSFGAHVFMIMLVFTGFWSSTGAFPVQTTETFIPLYLPPDLLLPEEDDTSGGGGGGGRNRLTAPSLGQPPRASDQQLVPPTPEPPSNSDPFLVAEPTIVAPQLANLFSAVDLLNLGDPEGIPAPPSSGPGTGGGIGAGQGRGVGIGGGPGPWVLEKAGATVVVSSASAAESHRQRSSSSATRSILRRPAKRSIRAPSSSRRSCARMAVSRSSGSFGVSASASTRMP